MDFSADGPGLATISQSIIEEERGLEESGEAGQAWKNYPESPRDKGKIGVALIRQTIVSLCKMHLSMKI